MKESPAWMSRMVVSRMGGSLGTAFGKYGRGCRDGSWFVSLCGRDLVVGWWNRG